MGMLCDWKTIRVHLGALGLLGALEYGSRAAVSEDSVKDSVVDVVVETRVHRRELDADHESVFPRVSLKI